LIRQRAAAALADHYLILIRTRAHRSVSQCPAPPHHAPSPPRDLGLARVALLSIYAVFPHEAQCIPLAIMLELALCRPRVA